MKTLLRLKHWQLFLLLVVIPFLVSAALIAYPLATNNLFGLIENVPTILGIVLFFFLVFFAWLSSMGIQLHHLVPEEVGLKARWFNIFQLIQLPYLALVIYFIYQLATNLSPDTTIAAILLPLHLLVMVGNLYFIAKALKSAELGKKAAFGEYVGEFFLICFFPIGIWLIQPRINRLIQ